MSSGVSGVHTVLLKFVFSLHANEDSRWQKPYTKPENEEYAKREEMAEKGTEERRNAAAKQLEHLVKDVQYVNFGGEFSHNSDRIANFKAHHWCN